MNGDYKTIVASRAATTRLEIQLRDERRARWFLNPFTFFPGAWCFGCKGLPCVDSLAAWETVINNAKPIPNLAI